MLAVLCSPVVSRVRLALLYTASLLATINPSIHSITSHVQLSKHSPFIDQGGQRRTNTWSQNKDSVLLGGSRHFWLYYLWYRCEWVEEICRAKTKILIILSYKIWVTHHPCCFQNISSTNSHLSLFESILFYHDIKFMHAVYYIQ